MNHLALILPSIERIGGAERQTLLLAQGLAHRGWRITLVALSGNAGEQQHFLAEQQIEFLPLEMRKGILDPRGWRRFLRWLHTERPDLLHAHLPHAVWMARIARLAAPVRALVDTVHSPSAGGISRKLGYRLTSGLSDCVTAVSQSTARSYCAARMLAPTKVSVIPNAIDTRFWQPNGALRQAARDALGCRDRFLWLAVGRLEAVKDYPTLLRAFADLPDAWLVIAGDGPRNSELRQFAESLTLGHRVRFVGFQRDVHRLLCAADAFVHCSFYEGLPLALLEAASCGLPAVATDVPGSREVLLHRQTGILVKPHDSAALAQAMRELAQRTPAERTAMGERARSHVERNFSLAPILDRWENLYRSLLQANAQPARWPRQTRRP